MIYALSGKKLSGKSTAASYLSKKLIARRLNFKDALVSEIKENFPDLLLAMVETMEKMDYDGLNPWTAERLFEDKPKLMRTLLQNYGTNLRRKENPDYWVDRWKHIAKDIEIDIITDDVRFINEAQAVKDMGGIVIRIEREDLPHTDRHLSELEMDEIVPDYTVSLKTGEHQKLYDFLDFIIDK